MISPISRCSLTRTTSNMLASRIPSAMTKGPATFRITPLLIVLYPFRDLCPEGHKTALNLLNNIGAHCLLYGFFHHPHSKARVPRSPGNGDNSRKRAAAPLVQLFLYLSGKGF